MVGVRTSAWRPWAAFFVVHVGFAGKHGVHGSYFRNSSATDQQEQQGTVAAKAPALPRGAVRGCSYRGGSDFRHRRQILGQDTYLMENFFENDAFKEKIY